MKINIKRLLIFIGLILLTVLITGGTTWYSLNNISTQQKKQISFLQDQVDALSNKVTLKLEEKKALELAAAEAAAAEAAKKSNKKATLSTAPTPTSQQTEPESEPTPEPVAASQILYFYSPACGTCMAQQPIVLELQSEGVFFVFFNVLETPSYISQYGIQQVPTFILNGQRRVQFFTKPELLAFWNTYK